MPTKITTHNIHQVILTSYEQTEMFAENHYYYGSYYVALSSSYKPGIVAVVAESLYPLLPIGL